MKIHVSNNKKRLTDSGILTIPDFTILTGENGAGKTQLLETIFFSSANDLRYSIDQSLYDSYGYYWEHDYSAILFFDDGSPIEQISLTLPGMIDQSNNTSTNFITKLESLWPELERIKIALPLIAGLSFQTEDDKISALISRYSTFMRSNIAEPSYNMTPKPITPDGYRKAKHISDRLNIPIIDIQKQDFLITMEVPNSVLSPALDLLFHQHHLKTKYHKSLVAGVKSPLDLFNEILLSMPFDYEATYVESESDFIIPPVSLIEKSSGNPIKLFELSSGEKTIMSLIFTLYNTISNAEFPKAILFDEPDAFLHPSMVKTFLDVVQDTIVVINQVKVIMTTHSPSTVALAPEESLYIMHKKVGYPEKVDKATAITSLTAGLNGLFVSYEHRRQVFVESNKDQAYYESIYQLLVLEGNMRKDVHLTFISSGILKVDQNGDRIATCDQVVAAVNVLRVENNHIFGIVDWDLERDDSDFLKVMGKSKRYSIDNYLLDPLLLGLLLLKNLKITADKLNVPGFKYVNAQHITTEQAQAIVDFICLEINKTTKSTDLGTDKVKLLNGIEINTPTWFLMYHGHKLEKIIVKTFPSLIDIAKVFKGKNLNQIMIDTVISDFPGLMSKDFEEILKSIENS
jgi:AAA15 family ATPase/GTPase